MTDTTTKTPRDIDDDFDKYYYYFNLITENVRNGYDLMVLKYCALTLPLIPGLIEKTKRDFGEFDVNSIPAIELGARMWAARGDKGKLKEIERLVASYPELAPWRIHIDRAYERLREIDQ